MGGDWSRVVALKQGLAEGRLRGPRLFAPGPFVDGPQDASPMFLSVTGPAQAREAVRELAARGVDFIKAQAALSPESFRALSEEARARGIPFAGHVPEAVSALEVVGSSPASIEHVSPALPGDAGLMLAGSAREDELRRELLELGRLAKDPSAPAAQRRARTRALQDAIAAPPFRPKLQALLDALRVGGVRVTPTLVWSEAQLPESAALDESSLRHAPAALREDWTKRRRAYLERADAETFARHRRINDRSRALVGELHRAGVKLLAGTDSFDAFVLPGESLHRELERLVASGLPPQAALRAATWSGAELLGESDARGSVEAGKIADLVLLDADPLHDIRATRAIHAVIQAGRVLARAELDALLAGVETAAAAAKP
jgi:imidazolonepropionase-like amidohydrolase